MFDVLFKSVFSHWKVEQKSNEYTVEGESKDERDAGEYCMIIQ
jgi:hypothetical protein